MLTCMGLLSWPWYWHVSIFSYLGTSHTFLLWECLRIQVRLALGSLTCGILQRPKGMLPSLLGPSRGGCGSSSLGIICDLSLPGPAALWRCKHCVVFCSCIDELYHCFGLIAVSLLLTNLYKVQQEESLWVLPCPQQIKIFFPASFEFFTANKCLALLFGVIFKSKGILWSLRLHNLMQNIKF